jgi:hypothetical protein
VKIRSYQPGDEDGQVAVFNAAAADLPTFVPASADEVRRRFRARDFDPLSRLYAEVGSTVVGYIALKPDGRLSYPWCLPGHEHHGPALLTAALERLRMQGLPRAYAAYRNSWSRLADFWLANGFFKARDIFSYQQGVNETPTLMARPNLPIVPLQADDLPHVVNLMPGLITLNDPAALRRHFLQNPLIPAEAYFVMRQRGDQRPIAVGLLLDDPTFANPAQLDGEEPSFRLGAFGMEKADPIKVNGLFSFVAQVGPREITPIALDLMAQAGHRLSEDTHLLAAQAPSDQPHLTRFYDRYFQRQGSFPVYERTLGT